MAKQTTPSLQATKRAARAPSAAVVTKATPAGAMAAVAQVLAKAQPAPAPATPAPAKPAPVVVALRGGLAIAAVQATGKVYRVTAPHNVAWWAQVNTALAAGKGSAQVAALVQAGVPAIMVGYLVRRGYLKAV